MSAIHYEIDRKLSRKHTYITIQKDGSVLVKTNYLTGKKQIQYFIDQKANWIHKKQDALLCARKIDESKIYILGELHERGILTSAELDMLYRDKAEEIIIPLVEKWSRMMQLYPNRIGFRKTKTRWGSCSAKDNLSFNTQLAKTPLAFIEYVVVHELAHITHKNHSRNFWDLVGQHLPDFKQRRNLIKDKHFII